MNQGAPLAIVNGRVVEDNGISSDTLRCVDGMIASVCDTGPQDGDTVIDAKGALVMPGLVDLGVFAIDKPAFRFGGITRAALMPDQSPPLDLPSRVS